mmetsp:Transcript_12483/g.8704  ORF Transcript_12483/g.8704 Transcript_12483/m.8704 type:complete len:91 (+) Transcript_12483:380-652(+)
MAAAIEPKNGNLVVVGGIDTKLQLYEINKKQRKREKLEAMSKLREYTGHQGLVTCCGFLSTEFFVSGSNDSSINLWEVDQARPITKYDDH